MTQGVRIGFDKEEPRTVRTLQPHQPLSLPECPEITVRPMAVSHSVPGAMAFVLESQGRMVGVGLQESPRFGKYIPAMPKPKRERFLLRKWQKRRQKIKKLKEKYAQATSEKERQAILEKVRRLAPLYPLENITGGSTKSS